MNGLPDDQHGEDAKVDSCEPVSDVQELVRVDLRLHNEVQSDVVHVEVAHRKQDDDCAPDDKDPLHDALLPEEGLLARFVEEAFDDELELKNTALVGQSDQ